MDKQKKLRVYVYAMVSYNSSLNLGKNRDTSVMYKTYYLNLSGVLVIKPPLLLVWDATRAS